MTIAEKLLRAKTDLDEVYDAGYDEGVTSVKTEEAKSSDDLIVSGSTVTVPSGYYAENASKSVSTATQATPSITVSRNGLITASATQNEGYVSGGTKSTSLNLSSGQDNNFQPYNIRNGISIFGVIGDLEAMEDYKPLIVQGCIGRNQYQRGLMYLEEDFNEAGYELFGTEEILTEEFIEIEITESSGIIAFTCLNHTEFNVDVYITCDVDYEDGTIGTYPVDMYVYTYEDNSVSIEADSEIQNFRWEIDGVRFDL